MARFASLDLPEDVATCAHLPAQHNTARCFLFTNNLRDMAEGVDNNAAAIFGCTPLHIPLGLARCVLFANNLRDIAEGVESYSLFTLSFPSRGSHYSDRIFGRYTPSLLI